MAAITQKSRKNTNRLIITNKQNEDFLVEDVAALIEEVNALSDGTIETDNLELTGTLGVDGVSTFGSVNNYSVATGITAFATGGQASATALTKEFNDVTTVATAGDSVKLVTAVAGAKQVVKNSGATALAIFPSTSDSIDALAVNLAVWIQPGSTATFTAKNATIWESNIDASLTLSAPTTLKGRLELKAANSAGNTATTIVNASQAAARTYTIPDAGDDAEFFMTEGSQNINGTPTIGGVYFEAGTLYANVAGGVNTPVLSELITDEGIGIVGDLKSPAAKGIRYTGTITNSGTTTVVLATMVGTAAFTTVPDIAAGATQDIVITNTLVTDDTIGMIVLQTNTAANGSVPRIKTIVYSLNTITITLVNSAVATATGGFACDVSFQLFQLA